MKRRYLAWLAVIAVFLGGAYGAWVNKYEIYDYLSLKNYTAPPLIAKLADDSTMTDKGRKIFYVNKPQVSDRAVFRSQCLTNSKPEQTIVLGCYNGTRIYIFKIDDVELDGVEQVTAAHEMLHAAYDRLSAKERKKVDELVMDRYRQLNDSRINELAANYEKQEPGSVPNELHSILGTEVKDVGGDLENYYKRYFMNRHRVVDYALSYRQKFDDLKKQVSKYDADLSLRKAEIDRLNNALQAKLDTLNTMKSYMDEMLSKNRVKPYNDAVDDFNHRVSEYNAQIEKVKALTAEYNKIVEERNRLAVQQQNLANSLDSRFNPIDGR